MSETEEKKPLSHDERLQELRERLYSRGVPSAPQDRNELVREALPVAHAWDIHETPAPSLLEQRDHIPDVPIMRRRSPSYRVKALVGGLIFFVIALALSGSFLLFGNNTISGKNISLSVQGPFAAPGGGELALQVTIANQNNIPIESATLIVEYPPGTQSIDEKGKNLSRERLSLDHIAQGEVRNVPLRARVFGEENAEETVLVSIEYRIAGSNAMFYKDATPLNFKISSSPVVLFISNVSQVSSGQGVELTVDVTSNSPTDISNLLLKAEYPSGFDYSDAKPLPVSGRDTWSIANLKPSEKKTITVKGILIGSQDESKVFRFSLGVPNDRDVYSLASVLTAQQEEIKIEQPFLSVGISVNGSQGGDAVLTSGSSAQVTVSFTNSLSTTLYEGKIVVDLSGTGLNKSQVSVIDGYYDSSKNTITWDSQSNAALKSIAPGKSSSVSFSVTPSVRTQTPQIELAVSVEGNRVSENQVSQKLSGTATQKIKVESVVALSSSALYSIGAFTNTGPLPARAEEATTYNILWYVKNGTNAVADGVVTATLPPYVAWIDRSTTPTVFSYNPQTREVSWRVGDLASNEEREAEFQISFTPSVSQVGQEPTLVSEQRLRATDRFTQSTLRSTVPALTTRLSADPDHEKDDGRVAPKAGG